MNYIEFWSVGPRYRVDKERESERRERLRKERDAMKAAGFSTEYLFKFKYTDPQNVKDLERDKAEAMARHIESKIGIPMEVGEGGFI